MYMYIHMYMYSASTKLEYQVETLCLALYCLAGGKAHVIALKKHEIADMVPWSCRAQTYSTCVSGL